MGGLHMGEIDKDLEATMLTMAQQYREEGEQNAVQSVIVTMLSKGVKPSLIAQYTNFSLQEIEKLAKILRF